MKSGISFIFSLLVVVLFCSQFCFGDSSKPVLVNIQIDVKDEADKDCVYRVLDEVEKRGWNTTVYFTGEVATKYPDVVKDIHNKKHQIAVSGWFAKEDLSQMNYQEQLNSISRSFQSVRKAINKFHEAYVADFKPIDLKQNSDTFRVLQDLNVRSNAGFLASQTKTHPYHTDYDFIAIPIAFVSDGNEDIPLIDEIIFGSETSAEDYFGYLIKRYDQSLVTKEPFAISLRPSVITSDEQRFQTFVVFLDYLQQTGGQVVMTDFMTTMANPYISNIQIYGPDTAKSGSTVKIDTTFEAHCDCPEYYLRTYGKYYWSHILLPPFVCVWSLRSQNMFGDADIGIHGFSTQIELPFAFWNNYYVVRVVGRACHGECWPWVYNYEAMAEKYIKTYCIEDWEEIRSILEDAYDTIQPCGDCAATCGPYITLAIATKFPPLIRLAFGCVLEFCPECGWNAAVLLKDIFQKIMDCSSWGTESEFLSATSLEVLTGGTAEIIGAYSDWPADTNGNGLYDYINVDVGINVFSPGVFGLTGWIKDGNETVTLTTDYVELDVGNQTITLNFDGRVIRNQGVDGPYNLTCLLEDQGATIIDYNENMYVTSAYNHMDFELVEFTDGYIEYTVDDNNDGFYDSLIISVEVNVTKPGDYEVVGILEVDPNIVLLSKNHVTLLPGVQSIPLDFNGMLIYDSNANGPYDIAHLYIIDEQWTQIDHRDYAYATASYMYSDFQPSGRVSGIVTDQNSVPLSNIYVLAIPKGTTFAFDDFNNGIIGPEWYVYDTDGLSIAEANGEIAISGTITGYGWSSLRYNTYYSGDVEASIKIKTPSLNGVYEFTAYESSTRYGVSNSGGAYWGYGRLSDGSYWYGDAVIPAFGDEDQNFHTLKIGYDSGKQEMSFYVDDTLICTAEDVNLNDVRFILGVEGYSIGWEMDIRLDDFRVGEFLPGEQEYAASVFTDHSGSYIMPGLASGSYKFRAVSIADSNLFINSTNAEVIKGQTTVVNFVLQKGGVIVGRITDFNGINVSDVRVDANGPVCYSATSDSNGLYVLKGLETGTYTLHVIPSNPNLFEDSNTIDINIGGTNVVNFTLQEAGSITGYITDVNGMPIDNVYMFLSSDETPRYAVDANGKYMIPGLYPGTYTVNIDASETDFLDDTNSVVVNLGETTISNFVLQEGRVYIDISGYISNTDGQSLDNCYVEVSNEYNGMGQTTSTDANGYFNFGGLSSGFYGIDFEDEEWKYSIVELNEVNATQDLVLDIKLLRIGIDVSADSSLYANGDTVEVNISVMNNDACDLIDWQVFAELDGEDEDVVLDFNSFPINLASGETGSYTIRLTIPEDNPISSIELYAGVIKPDYYVSSNIGLLESTAYKDWWGPDLIHVSPNCEGANFDQINPVDFTDFSSLSQYWGAEGVGIPGDIDGDQLVDISDLALLARYWLKNCPQFVETEKASSFGMDIDGNKVLDLQDLLILTDKWLEDDHLTFFRHPRLKELRNRLFQN